ncbi:MAG: NUDIX hydrolase [Candidatus Omnitrophica bacterium]|nr:NUDIX hydrolase [Candidatus Omnitrophota bacterium]
MSARLPLPMKPFVLVLRGILFDDRGRVLLMRRHHQCLSWPKKWEFPGGKPDSGEILSESLIREFREETGMEVVPERMAFSFEWEREQDKVVYLIFKVTRVSGSLQISEEHEEAGWFTPQEALQLDVSPPLVDSVRALCD